MSKYAIVKQTTLKDISIYEAKDKDEAIALHEAGKLPLETAHNEQTAIAVQLLSTIIPPGAAQGPAIQAN